MVFLGAHGVLGKAEDVSRSRAEAHPGGDNPEVFSGVAKRLVLAQPLVIP
jgi:hypothetical protein